VVRADDVLELLLPGADAAALRRAHEVTQFLRLLCDDARRSRAPAVGLDFERARGVLADHGREALERALADLLRHHLAAVQPVDSFLWAGQPEHDAARAWREVEVARAEFDELPELPAPGETALDCGARVLSALARLTSEPWTRLWHARWAHAAQGARAAEELYRELLAATRRPRPGVLVQRAAIAGVAECLLERGALREVRAWLGEHALQLSVDPRLRQLFAWTRLALEDIAGARAALHGLRPWSGPIPHCLGDLRAVNPDWIACLAGRIDPATERALTNSGEIARGSRPDALRGRIDCGASAFVALAFLPDRGTEVLAFDVAPALAHRREGWLAEREGASAVPGEREQQLVARAAPSVEHAAPGRALDGVLGGAATRALALVPILDEEGDATGWLHLEFEHHLVPAGARLAEAALAWRRAASEARARAAVEEEHRAPARPPEGLGTVFRELVDELGLKTTLRRWSGYSVDPTDPVLVAQGGEGQGFGDFEPGRGRALARALATRGRIEWDAPDERLSVHARACSGVVLPLRFEGLVRGLLAVESSRRRDFQGIDLDAWSARADETAIALRTAQFRAWHRERFGFEPWFDARRTDFRAFAQRVVRAARLRGAVTVAGAAGVGKTLVARWLHFESSRVAGPFVVHACDAPAALGEWPRLLVRAAGGTLVLDDVDALEGPLQALCLRELETADDGPTTNAARIVAITRRPGDGSRATTATDGGAAQVGLRDDLRLRLDRMRLCVPNLAERREEIPALVEALAQRFALAERSDRPRFRDGAHAVLWRQPWSGNVRELENLVYQLVVALAGRDVEAEDVVRVAAESGRVLARRMATRNPRREDLRMALRTTCTAGARSNKTRAALYLGWDPDTLVARLRDAGLSDEVFDQTVWEARAGPEEPSTSGDSEREPCTRVPSGSGIEDAPRPAGSSKVEDAASGRTPPVAAEELARATAANLGDPHRGPEPRS
jgi:hypothetical protein